MIEKEGLRNKLSPKYNEIPNTEKKSDIPVYIYCNKLKIIKISQEKINLTLARH